MPSDPELLRGTIVLYWQICTSYLWHHHAWVHSICIVGYSTFRHTGTHTFRSSSTVQLNLCHQLQCGWHVYTHTHTWAQNGPRYTHTSPHQRGMLIDLSQSGCRVTLVSNTTLKVERSLGCCLFSVVIWNVDLGVMTVDGGHELCSDFALKINQYISWLMRVK